MGILIRELREKVMERNINLEGDLDGGTSGVSVREFPTNSGRKGKLAVAYGDILCSWLIKNMSRRVQADIC